MKKLIALILFLAGIAYADPVVIPMGKPLTISLQSCDGTAPFTYQWLKNGKPISGATTSSLVVTMTALTNAAAYSLKVSNAAGSAVSNTALVSINASVSLSP